MNKTDNLLLKMEKDAKLTQNILKNQKNCNQIMNSYLETPNIPEGIFKKVNGHQIYFYFGHQQPKRKRNLPQVLIYLVKNFQPNLNTGYKLVFFNDKCMDNALQNFRQTFSCLRLTQITALIEFVVVNPSFYHKTMDWMTFGAINKFIKEKTKFVLNYQKLWEHLNITEKQFAQIVPPALYKNQLPQLFGRTASISSLRINITGQQRSEQEKGQLSEFQRSIRSMLMKPGKQSIKIQDYEIGAQGIPNILKMLIFYFDSHQEALLLQGIFRKSANVDQENETINEILSKNYDYILEVKDPYIIANLIKRFFSSLKIPIFPFAQYEKLMQDKNITDKVKHLKNIFDSLPQINRLTLTFVITFFIDKILPNESSNKMTVHNISVCFSPTIFRSQVPSPADFINISQSINYTSLLLTNFTDIFGTRLEIQANFRHSYEKQKKKFEDELDVGIDDAMRQAQKEMENLHLSTFCRTSSKYQENIEDAINFQLEQEQPNVENQKDILPIQGQEQSIVEGQKDLLGNPDQEQAIIKEQKQDFLSQRQQPAVDMAQIEEPNKVELKEAKKDENLKSSKMASLIKLWQNKGVITAPNGL